MTVKILLSLGVCVYVCVVVKTKKSSASLHCLRPEIAAIHLLLCLSLQLSASVKRADERSSHEVRWVFSPAVFDSRITV